MSDKKPVAVVLTDEQIRQVAREIGIDVTEVHIYPDKILLKRRYNDIDYRDSPEALKARKHDYMNDLLANGPNPGPVIGWT